VLCELDQTQARPNATRREKRWKKKVVEEEEEEDEAASEGRREKRRALNLSLPTDLRREPSSWPIDCQPRAHDVAIA